MTVDLLTGKTKRHDPDDYHTKSTAVAPAKPGTLHPRWSTFLNEVTSGDDAMIAFLQRWCGYCLTAHTSEQALIYLHGTGGNGKGVFLKTIQLIWGDYAVTAPIELLIASKNERHPTEIAKLKGARIVIAQETEAGRAWDEAKLKLLTGSDVLTGRFMRQDFFDFMPTHKLMIAGNTLPRLRIVDPAIKRRFLRVPFTATFAKPDTELAEKLKLEWPAILRWAIDGCLDWRERGLMVPKSVDDASDKYFVDEDTLGQWLGEDTQRPQITNDYTRTNDLFFAYKQWCDARNLGPGSERTFSMQLEDRGFVKTKNPAGQSCFEGLMLKSHVDRPPPGWR
jgi:putative DNA primase/helicase